jgi:hypothetical protein
VESLLAKGDPTLPLIPSADMSRLDLHSTGVYSLYETLMSKPIPTLEYRECSRYLSYVTTDRMSQMGMLDELPVAWNELDDTLANRKQNVRKYYQDMVGGARRGYSPFVVKNNAHIWFWDEDTMTRAMSMLRKAQLPYNLFFAFAADPLSEVGAVSDQRRSDLIEEYNQGVAYMSHVLAVIKWAVVDCRARPTGRGG